MNKAKELQELARREQRLQREWEREQARRLPASAPSATRAARRLNDHHLRTWAGFYASNAATGSGRYFSARVRAGKLEVTPDFGETWKTVEDLASAAFHDHNGRSIHL